MNHLNHFTFPLGSFMQPISLFLPAFPPEPEATWIDRNFRVHPTTLDEKQRTLPAILCGRHTPGRGLEPAAAPPFLSAIRGRSNLSAAGHRLPAVRCRAGPGGYSGSRRSRPACEASPARLLRRHEREGRAGPHRGQAEHGHVAGEGEWPPKPCCAEPGRVRRRGPGRALCGRAEALPVSAARPGRGE